MLIINANTMPVQECLASRILKLTAQVEEAEKLRQFRDRRGHILTQALQEVLSPGDAMCSRYFRIPFTYLSIFIFFFSTLAYLIDIYISIYLSI